MLAVDEPSAPTGPVLQMLGPRVYEVTSDPGRALELIRSERLDVLMINADLLGSEAFTLHRGRAR